MLLPTDMDEIPDIQLHLNFKMQDSWQDPQLPETSNFSPQPSCISSLKGLLESREFKAAVTNDDPTDASLILLQNAHLHHQLLDCMLAFPNISLEESIGTSMIQAEIANMPYKCFQLMSAMDNRYVQQMFDDSTDDNEQDEKSILTHLFSVFDNENPNQTAAGYVLRVCEQLLMRHNSYDLYDWFQTHPLVLDSLFRHFGSYSSVGILVRLVQLEVQKVSNKQRTQFFEVIFNKVISFALQLSQPDLVDGLIYFIEEQLERALCSDHVLDLSDQVNNINNMKQVSLLLQSGNPNTTAHAMIIITKVLNHYKVEEVKEVKASHRSFMGHRNPPPQLHIEKGLLDYIIEILKASHHYVCQLERKNQCGFVNGLTFRYLEALEQVALYQTDYLSKLLDTSVAMEILSVTTKFPFNNLLHNCTKNIIIGHIKTTERQDLFYKDSSDFLPWIFDHLKETNCLYRQHLFQILHQIINLEPNLEQKVRVFSHVHDIDKVMEIYHGMKKQEGKLQLQQPTNQSLDYQLTGFDPTNNVDQMSPYYYKQMAIDDNFQNQNQNQGGYNQWTEGVFKSGILEREAKFCDSNEVDSLVISPVEEQNEKQQLTIQLSNLKNVSLLDSQSDTDANLILSGRRGVNRDSSIPTEEETLMPSKQMRQNIEKVASRLQSVPQGQFVLPQQKQLVSVSEKTVLRRIQQDENSQVSIPDDNAEQQEKDQPQKSKIKATVKYVLSPLIWLGQFIWNVSG